MRVQCIDSPPDSALAAGPPTTADEQSISLRCLWPSLPAFVDSRSYVANHHETCFGAVCWPSVFVCPCMQFQRLLYSGWPANYGQKEVYFFRCLWRKPFAMFTFFLYFMHSAPLVVSFEQFCCPVCRLAQWIEQLFWMLRKKNKKRQRLPIWKTIFNLESLYAVHLILLKMSTENAL